MGSDRVVFVGGGTCAGKTTAVRQVAARTGVRVFSVDDRLLDFAGIAEAEGNSFVGKALSNDFERRWMRDPAVQLAEMLRFYADIFPYAMADLHAFVAAAEGTVVAEGIAFLPELLHAAAVPADDCLFVTCSRALHDERYASRDWTPLMLEGCSDPERAFELWMERDELFAEHVRSQCARLGYAHVSVDSSDPDALSGAIERLVFR